MVERPPQVNKWGYQDKTRWALVTPAPYAASGLNEVIIRTQFRSAIIAFCRILNIHMKRDRYEIHDLSKPYKPKKGEPGYVLTMDERFEFERKWDAMIERNRTK